MVDAYAVRERNPNRRPDVAAARIERQHNEHLRLESLEGAAGRSGQRRRVAGARTEFSVRRGGADLRLATGTRAADLATTRARPNGLNGCAAVSSKVSFRAFVNGIVQLGGGFAGRSAAVETSCSDRSSASCRTSTGNQWLRSARGSASNTVTRGDSRGPRASQGPRGGRACAFALAVLDARVDADNAPVGVPVLVRERRSVVDSI